MSAASYARSPNEPRDQKVNKNNGLWSQLSGQSECCPYLSCTIASLIPPERSSPEPVFGDGHLGNYTERPLLVADYLGGTSDDRSLLIFGTYIIVAEIVRRWREAAERARSRNNRAQRAASVLTVSSYGTALFLTEFSSGSILIFS
jgi:hypothetical protein